MSARVAVLGGGLAGVTAALDCADAGAQVTLLEVRPRLGGAAYSVERDGLTVDNGQHVFLRCCDAYRGLLARLGSESLVRVQERLEIPVLRPGRPTTLLRRGNLPVPAHLARALLSFSPLPPLARLSAATAVKALANVDPDDPENDRVSFGQWLAERGQSPEAIAALWDLVVLPTLNVRAAEASLALGAFVFQEGLLKSADAGDIGFHDAPLAKILGEPALRTLQAAGVAVRLGWRGQRVLAGAPLEILGSAGGREERIRCDAAIVALPHLRAAEVLPAQEQALADTLRSIGVSPIVNLHVVYDRRVCEFSFLAGVESPVQYVFDRTAAGGAPQGSQYLAVSLSGADEEMKMSEQELRERYVPAMQELLPAARDAKVLRFTLTREHAATFRAVPGVGALRPGPRTGVRGLALAGAYTKTRWPATLESAVLSGHAAAAAVLADIGAAPRARAVGVAR